MPRRPLLATCRASAGLPPSCAIRPFRSRRRTTTTVSEARAELHASPHPCRAAPSAHSTSIALTIFS
eukprot:223789-Prymnesium_polylepis.1